MINVFEICEKYNIKISKRLGQNFLLNNDVLDDIINAAELGPDDYVLEIGPGLGVLTERIAEHAGHILALDLDENLVKIAKTELHRFSNLKIEHANILNFSNEDLVSQLYDGKKVGSYKVVANIPYVISSPILRKFTAAQPQPDHMVLMIQKEVAQRISAKPGKLSILGIAVQLYSDVTYIRTVSRTDFHPAPKVDSAVVSLKPTSRHLDLLKNEGISVDEFMHLVKIGFAQRRKQLHNTLSAGLHITSQESKDFLQKAGFDSAIRPQNLSIEQWISLIKIVGKSV